MEKSKLAYYILTGLFTFAMVGGGIADIIKPEPIAEAITHLGYPAFVFTLLGVLKLAGVAAITAPGFLRLKEWAYAGFVFDLAGAVYSHICVGDPPAIYAAPLVLLGLAVGSWATRPANRKL